MFKGKDFQNDYSHLESNLDDFEPKIYNSVLYLYVPRKSDNQILNTMMIKAKNKFKL